MLKSAPAKYALTKLIYLICMYNQGLPLNNLQGLVDTPQNTTNLSKDDVDNFGGR